MPLRPTPSALLLKKLARPCLNAALPQPTVIFPGRHFTLGKIKCPFAALSQCLVSSHIHPLIEKYTPCHCAAVTLQTIRVIRYEYIIHARLPAII